MITLGNYIGFKVSLETRRARSEGYLNFEITEMMRFLQTEIFVNRDNFYLRVDNSITYHHFFFLIRRILSLSYKSLYLQKILAIISILSIILRSK